MSKPKHYLDIRIVFEKQKDEYDPDYFSFVPVKAYPKKSTVPADELYGVAETWAQSDHFILLSPELIIEALSGNRTDLTR
jgi:hypothetical protein